MIVLVWRAEEPYFPICRGKNKAEPIGKAGNARNQTKFVLTRVMNVSQICDGQQTSIIMRVQRAADRN